MATGPARQRRNAGPQAPWIKTARRDLSPRKRGLDHQWDKLRGAFVQLNPLCVECLKAGRVTPVAHVDHIIPHKGNDALRLDWNNLQSLCVPHHTGHKQRLERAAGY